MTLRTRLSALEASPVQLACTSSTLRLVNLPLDEIPLTDRAELLALFFGISGDQVQPHHSAWIDGTSRADGWIAARAANTGNATRAALDWLGLRLGEGMYADRPLGAD